ncbi:MAG: hypothetical protein LBN11_08155 [Tannerella sp.]|nr:hypothetical protein [Tannerella sp.]
MDKIFNETDFISNKIANTVKGNTFFSYPTGLTGKLGFCIYLYTRNKLDAKIQYENLADELIDVIYSGINEFLPPDIENGLTGIGLGIRYLIKEHFIEGDINELLEKIDISVFKTIYFPKDGLVPDNRLKAELLYYCGVRYEDREKGASGECILKKLIFNILNSCTSISDDFLEEPDSFSLSFRLPFFLYSLGTVAACEPFRHKVKTIMDEMTNKVVSLLPVLHSHRLYLLWGMCRLAKTFRIPAWEEHIRLLRNSININRIISNEIQGEDIFLKTGLTGIGYLLQDYNKMVDDTEKILYDPALFHERITTSVTWRKLQHDEQFLKTNMGLSGFCGAALLLLNNMKD